MGKGSHRRQSLQTCSPNTVRQSTLIIIGNRSDIYVQWGWIRVSFCLISSLPCNCQGIGLLIACVTPPWVSGLWLTHMDPCTADIMDQYRLKIMETELCSYQYIVSGGCVNATIRLCGDAVFPDYEKASLHPCSPLHSLRGPPSGCMESDHIPMYMNCHNKPLRMVM